MTGPGYRYFTVQVFEVDREHAGILARGGAEGRAPLTLGKVARISFVRDPDGNWIEISQRASLTGPASEGVAMEARLDWFGCATFRLTVGKLVVFLDAYLDRVPNAPQPGLVPEDVERADWIVVGHSHFDHLFGAERIAKRTGAQHPGLARDGADHGGAGRSARADDRRGRRRARAPLGRRGRRRLPEPTLLRVVAQADEREPRGLPRRPRPHLAGAAGALPRARRALRLARPRRAARTCRRARRARAATAARSCTTSARPPGRSSTRTPRATGAGSCATCAPTWRSSRPPAAATSTASRSRARSRSSSRARSTCCARAASSSATTTTGCPASRARST